MLGLGGVFELAGVLVVTQLLATLGLMVMLAGIIFGFVRPPDRFLPPFQRRISQEDSL